MDKNSTIGFILIAVILIGFSFFQSREAQKQAQIQWQIDSAARAEAVMLEALKAETDTLDAEAFVQGAAPVFKDSLLQSAYTADEKVVTLENSKLVVEFSTKGAQPLSVKVKDYYNYDSTDLYIFKPGHGDYSLTVYAGELISTRNFNFQLASVTDSTVVMRLPFSAGGYIEQKYTLHADSYSVDNQLAFVGMANYIPRNVSVFDIDFNVTVPRMEKGLKNESQYSKINWFFDGDKKPAELGRGRSGAKRVDSKFSWFAFQQQFFSAIMCAPQQFASGELAVDFCQEDDPERNLMACTASMRADLRPDAAGNCVVPFEFYFGPNNYQILKGYNRSYEKMIPLGGWLVSWFTKYAIIPMFNFFHRYFSNFGLIILLMTIVIKLVVSPLTNKSYASSAKMAALKPEIEKINAKYPNSSDQQEMMKKQQATMNLYKRAGVSPMGGCLPTLLTFPILWAMFRFFPASIELRQQSFLWCHDLSSYDSIVDFGFSIPLLGNHISLFALLMALTMFIYSKMTMASQPASNDPSAASMRFMTLWMMPIMMFFICNNLSAALSYYYLLSQLVSMLQIWLVRKTVDTEALLTKVRLSEGKPIPKSKWQQRLEEAQKLQEQQMREQRKKQGRK